MFKILTKRNVAYLKHWNRPRWETSRSHWQVDRWVSLVDRVWFCIEWTRYLTRTFFNQYSKKHIKIIHQSVGDVGLFFGASCDGWL